MKKYLIYVLDIYRLEYLNFIYFSWYFFPMQEIKIWNSKSNIKLKSNILNRIVYISEMYIMS